MTAVLFLILLCGMVNAKCAETTSTKLTKERKKKPRPVMKQRGSDCGVESVRAVLSLATGNTAIAFPLPCDLHCAHCADLSSETQETNRWENGAFWVGVKSMRWASLDQSRTPWSPFGLTETEHVTAYTQESAFLISVVSSILDWQ